VIAAVQQTDSTIGEATLAMLQSPETLPFEACLIPLINELAHLQTEFILVLDDYHLITAPKIHDALTFLLEHLPTHVHVAIATRIDPPIPLSKWRVRADLTELHTDD
jgi:LuxR family maltose regulon positive regulatory protein